MDFPSHLEQSSGRRRGLGKKENPKSIQGYLRKTNPMIGGAWQAQSMAARRVRHDVD